MVSEAAGGRRLEQGTTKYLRIELEATNPMISTAGPGVSGAGAASAQVAGKLGSLEECAGCHKKIHDK